MSNELATKNAWDIAVPEEAQPVPERPKNWLDRVALLTGNSGSVTEGKAAPLQYQVGKSTFLPKEFAALVIARRPHAIHIKGGTPVKESYDINEEEYSDIAGLEMDPAVKKDSTQSAKTGQDVLLWMPAIGQFGFLHLAATALDNLGEFIVAMPTKGNPPVPVVMGSSLRENKKMGFKWFVPRATEDEDLEIQNPTPEALTKALELFRKPRPQGRGDDQTEDAAPAAKGKRKSK